MIPTYALTELTTLADPLLDAWLDLYETSFTTNERILVSQLLKLLRQQQTGAPSNQHLLALTSTVEKRLAGLSMVEHAAALPATYLWYLAVQPEMRNLGLGAILYQQVAQMAFGQERSLIFEVEKPSEAQTPTDAGLRQRRIGFYRRNGAKLLGGIAYLQSVGSHCPPTPMHLMLHTQVETTPQAAFDLAAALFGSALHQIGDLTLE